MKLFYTETQFDFGKHLGETLEEVFSSDSNYLKECIEDNPNFVIDGNTLSTLTEKYSTVMLRDELIELNMDKLENYEFMASVGDDDDFDDDDFDKDDDFEFEEIDDFEDDDFDSKKRSNDDDDDDNWDDDFEDDDDDWEEEDLQDDANEGDDDY